MKMYNKIITIHKKKNVIPNCNFVTDALNRRMDNNSKEILFLIKFS